MNEKLIDSFKISFLDDFKINIYEVDGKLKAEVVTGMREFKSNCSNKLEESA